MGGGPADASAKISARCRGYCPGWHEVNAPAYFGPMEMAPGQLTPTIHQVTVVPGERAYPVSSVPAREPAGQKFCGDCGARLATDCPFGGASNLPGQKFCGECGMHSAKGAAGGRFAAPAIYTSNHLAERILTSKDHQPPTEAGWVVGGPFGGAVFYVMGLEEIAS
jgi:hypothetical protein